MVTCGALHSRRTGVHAVQAAFPLLMLAVASTVHGQEGPFSITPSLDQRVTYTDNARLAPRGEEQSDLIYNVTPSILFTADGNRVSGRANYAYNNQFYLNESERNTASHLINASGNVELLENFFFVDGSATRRERAQTVLDPIGFDDGVGPDRTTVTTWQISPYVTQRLGRFANTTARYTYDRVDSQRRSTGETYNFDIESGPTFGRFFWSGNFERQEIRYDDDRPGIPAGERVTLETVSGTGGVELTSRLSVFGTVGEERNEFLTTREDIDGSFWNAGFRWNPNVRTSIEGTVGERFFGQTRSLDIQHQRRRSVWQASYVQQVSTTRGQILVPDEDCIEFFLDQGFTPEQAFVLCGDQATVSLAEDVFVSERAQVSLRYNMRRSRWSLLAFRSERELLSERDEADDVRRDDTRYGVQGRFGWDLGARTAWDTTVSRTWVDYDEFDGADDRRERLWSLRTGLTRQMTDSMRGSLSYRHQQRSSEGEVAGYRENAVIATLNMTF